MTLQSVEASLSAADIEEFNKMPVDYAVFSPEYNERLQAWSPEKREKFFEWKNAKDNELLLQGGVEIRFKTSFRRSSQIPEDMLSGLAAGNTAVTGTDNSAPPVESKKKKGCCAIL